MSDLRQLMEAIRSSDEYMLEFLLNNGFNINETNNVGESLLFNVATSGESSILKYLIDRGADVNLPDERGVTPLMQCCMRLDRLKIKILIESQNLNINQQDVMGNTALFYLAARNYVNSCQYLIKNGADITICNNAGIDALSLLRNDDDKISLLELFNRINQ